VSSLRAGRFTFRTPTDARRPSLTLAPTKPPIQWAPRAISLRVKLPEREAGHTSIQCQYQEQVQLYRYSPIPLHGAHRDSVTLRHSVVRLQACSLKRNWATLFKKWQQRRVPVVITDNCPLYKISYILVTHLTPPHLYFKVLWTTASIICQFGTKIWKYQIPKFQLNSGFAKVRLI
jgi:hypothetical protein